MRSHIRLVLIAASFFAATIVCDATRAAENFELPPLSDNAALQYYQAFITMPALSTEQQALADNWSTTQLGVATSKLLDQCQVSFMFLHRAGQRPACDWGLDYDEGISMHLPYLAKGRTMARLALLDVRRALAAGNVDAAGNRIGDVMALARRLGGDYTLISMLVCYAVENMVVDTIAPYVPELGVCHADAVKSLAMLPPSPRLVHSVMCEKRLASSIVRQLKEAEGNRPGGWKEAWLGMASPEMPDVLKNVESLDEVIKMADDFQGVYDELALLMELPPKEFDAKYPEFAKRAQAANPMAELLLPAMDKVIATQRRTEARLAMLMAAIAVAEGGPEKLADIQDPFGDGPFTYRKLDDGFELSSQLVYEGQPVTLVVGPAAAVK